MLVGICVLPVIPMRKSPKDTSEMTNQVLFGETFHIIKKNRKWSYIELNHDQYQGWIDNKQYELIENHIEKYQISNKQYVNIKVNNIQQPLLLGSLIPLNIRVKRKLNISEKLSFVELNLVEKWFIKIAKKYLNSPYLWGGRTPLGIDCSGYTQMVYRFFDIQLPRDANQQIEKGKKINNYQNIKLGDLAFFAKNNKITHVGICLNKDSIIHASGRVRIDRLTKTGILNEEIQSHTHLLHTIKRIL
tara:strand:+ start:1234 stop:1971 length:738 start_codon:yes stop_codon:yes gene_type:complete